MTERKPAIFVPAPRQKDVHDRGAVKLPTLEFWDKVTQNPESFVGAARSMGSAVWRGITSNEDVGLIDTIANAGFPEDPSYSVIEDPLYHEYPELFSVLAGSRSRRETAYHVLRYNETRKALRDVLRDPDGAMVNTLVTMADPSMAIPFSSLANGARFVTRLSKTAKALTLTAVPAEVLISSQSPERTYNEGLAVAGLIVAAGAPLGALAHKTGVPKDVNDFRSFRNIDDGPGSTVGAAEAPNVWHRSMFEDLTEEALVGTRMGASGRSRLGIEDVPFNPVMRMAKSPVPRVRALTEELVDNVLLKKKNLRGEASATSAEAEFRVDYVWPMVQVLRDTDSAYLAYRKANIPAGDFRRSARLGKIWLDDKIQRLRGEGTGVLSYREFREEITRALRETDHHIPEVKQAAAAYQKHFDRLRADAQSVDLFTRQMRTELEILNARLIKMYSEVAGAESKAVRRELMENIAKQKDDIKALEWKIGEITEKGPTANGARGYAPRYWDRSKVMSNRADLESVLRRHFMRRAGAKPDEAALWAKETVDNILMDNPSYDLKLFGKPKTRKEAGSLRERTIDIPDRDVEAFLVNDIETLMRHQTRTIGMDVTLTRKFGDINMETQIAQIRQEYEELLKTAAPGEFEKLNAQMKADIRDVEGLRDRLRGTYGVPEDPFRPISRTARILKSVNVLAYMGGAAITSMSDLGRFVMVNGFRDTFEVAASTFKSERLRSLSRAELQRAGEGLDLVLGTRAMQMADIADVFGNRSGFEDAVLGSSQFMFMANGLNYWNTVMKEFAAIQTHYGIYDAVRAIDRGRATKRQIASLAASGIDENMAGRILDQIKKYGEDITAGPGRTNTRMPNTDLWDDAAAAYQYRATLGAEVNRIIITPGAGDRALWTSTEFGSVIAQFKSFGQAFVMRGLTRGLQEARFGAGADMNFVSGMMTMVGLGYLVNEIKGAIAGRDMSKYTFGQKLVDAIDRSGALGWFQDLNNVMETLTSDRFGMRAFTSDTHRPMLLSDMGNVLGPSFSTLDRSRRAVAGALAGSGSSAMHNASKVIPFQNHPLPQLLGQLVNPMQRPLSPKEN